MKDKDDDATSNTHILSEFLAKHLESFDTESEIIRLADYTIRPGVCTNVGPDDWPAIFEKILDADIVIFATPIWWGGQSSLVQRVVEAIR
jgi:multimeric flavodoxin WrbA